MTAERVHLATRLAEQVGLAIQNARLHADPVARRREAPAVQPA